MREWSPGVGAMRSEQGGRMPGSRVRRGGSGAAGQARVQECPSARLTPVAGVQLGVHQRDGQAACAREEGHSGKGEGPPRLPGGHSGRARGLRAGSA